MVRAVLAACSLNHRGNRRTTASIKTGQSQAVLVAVSVSLSTNSCILCDRVSGREDFAGATSQRGAHLPLRTLSRTCGLMGTCHLPPFTSLV